MSFYRPAVQDPTPTKRPSLLSQTIRNTLTSAGLLTVAILTPAYAATYTVTNRNDSGAGSLRQAILDANANNGADTITFQTGLSGTLTLQYETTGTHELDITDELEIIGPGAANFTIDGNNNPHVFNITANASTDQFPVTISGLTLTDARTQSGDSGNCPASSCGASGSAIRGVYVDLLIKDCLITDNTNEVFHWAGVPNDHVQLLANGGAISIIGSSSTLQLVRSTISGNSSLGIYGRYPQTVTLSHSTISNNNPGGGVGAGIFLYASNTTLTIDASTISSGVSSSESTNSSDGSTTINSPGIGGGIAFIDSGGTNTIQLTNTTISSNVAASQGGGVHIANSPFGIAPGSTAVTINSSTIIENDAYASGTAGGGITNLGTQATVNLYNSVIAAGYPLDLEGINFTATYSLIQNKGNVAVQGTTGNIFNTDPLLGALVSSSGLTQTHAPLANSPLVNAGDPSFNAAAMPTGTTLNNGFDQRCLPRTYSNTTIDIGAVEAQGDLIFKDGFEGYDTLCTGT